MRFVEQLTRLTSLNLSYNKINDIKGLDKPTALNSLDLRYNNITDIKGIKKLINLAELDLAYNLISKTMGLKDLYGLTELKLFGNPLRDIPQGLLGEGSSGNCITDLRNWWAETAIDGNIGVNTLVKLQVIGNGGAGKSSLLEALNKGVCNTNHTSTHGVKIEPVSYEVNGDLVNFRAWDFGGQEIYHGTHRLFIGSESLQMIVADIESERCAQTGEKVADREDDTQMVLHQPLLHYIRLCQRYSTGSSQLVVQNKVKVEKERDNTLYQATAAEGVDFYTTEAKTGRGIEFLRAELAEKRKGFLHYGMPMPKSWLAVQQYFLDNIDKPEFERMRLLTYDNFTLVCRGHQVMERSIPSLLKLLHHTGIIYTNDQLLKDTIITDQRWALEAIYKPLERGSDFFDKMNNEFRGRVRAKSLFKEFGETYSTSQKWLFLQFMQSCGLCFRINTNYREEETEDSYYIFPQFLPDRATPAINDTWKNRAKQVQTYYCELPYLDYYRIQQFIVTLGNKTQVENIWREGILIITSTGMFRVYADRARGTIIIQMEQPAVDGYLLDIINSFNEQGQDTVQWMAGPVGSGTPLNIDALRKQTEQKKVTAQKEQAAPITEDTHSTSSRQKDEGTLETKLPDVEQRQPKRLVISYASEDRLVLPDLRRHMDDYIENGYIQVLYDKEIQDGKNFWGDRIQDMFNNADGFLILVSQFYQNTEEKEYIWNKEIRVIENRHKNETIFTYCLTVQPVNYKERLKVFDAYKNGREILPENPGHAREAFLADFVKEVIGKVYLNIR